MAGHPTLTLDHVVYGTRDVARSVHELERLLGVRAAPGGRHPGRGTHNALMSLGGERYLEIIGPDPAQPGFQGILPFGLDDLTDPKIVTWAAKAPDLEARVYAARAQGYDPGEILPRSRELPNGTVLKWRLTAAGESHPNWLVPFLIDWGDSPHPSRTAPAGLTLERLRAIHPDPEGTRKLLEALGVELEIERGSSVQLIAHINAVRGAVEMR
ncbi:MAG: VOC family protein [Chloroflexi bacterium]|nr:VOC family protein [Chloroflexota bacterium]